MGVFVAPCHSYRVEVYQEQIGACYEGAAAAEEKGCTASALRVKKGSPHVRSVVNASLKQSRLSPCLNSWFGPGTVLSNRNLPYLDETKSSAQIAVIIGYTGPGDVLGTPKQPVPKSGRPTVYVASNLRGDEDEEIRTYIHEVGNVLAMQNYGADGAFRGPGGGPPTPSQKMLLARGLDPDVGYQVEVCVFGPAVVHITPTTITVTP